MKRSSGSPPTYFGFGSIPVEAPADTLAMIGAACAQLGERALVWSRWCDFSDVPHFEHVKVVGAVSHAAVFPACRAVVHLVARAPRPRPAGRSTARSAW